MAWCWFFVPLLLLAGLVGCVFDPPRAGIFGHFLRGDRLQPEPVEFGLVTRSDVFWLVEGEPLFTRWDQFVVRFSGPVDCDLCEAELTREDEGWRVTCPTFGNESRSLYDQPVVKVVETPLAATDPFDTDRQIDFPFRVKRTIEYSGGCTSRFPLDPPRPLPAFVIPTQDARYQLLAALVSAPGPDELSSTEEVEGHPGDGVPLTVRLVRRGEPRRYLARLERQGDGRLWQWQPLGDDAKWAENFSHQLHATEVTVRHARTGDVAAPPPASLTVRDGGQCFFDASGVVDLRRCRRSRDPADAGTPLPATPTYLHASRRTLTAWTVEFDAPRAEEELAIVFTLEVR